MIIDKKLIETLLEQNESVTLDFKREQYSFHQASDNEKSELLKDILAFSNADRISDAFILIGVEEKKGKKSNVVGVNKHLNESNIQEFINKKTNRPINFSYDTIKYDNKTIDIISIPIQQRPYFIKKDFGKVKANTVYIRRGSSTDVADPDEISKMNSTISSNLLGKRIHIYQRAYQISIKLRQALSKESSEKIKICQESRRWFDEFNLYLNPDIRYDFESIIQDVAIHDVRVRAYYSKTTKERYDDMVSHFDRIISLPKRIQNSLDSMLK